MQQLTLGVEVPADDLVDEVTTRFGQPDQDLAPVARDCGSLDEAPLLEPIDTIRHGARGDHGLLEQFTCGEFIGRT